MSLETALRLAGASLLMLAGLHVFFPKRFGWREEFARVSLLNRQIFYVHCVFICLALVLMGALCLVWPGALLSPSFLGELVAGGLAIFWLCRLGAQWLIYDARLWRGKRLETAAHLAFTGLWCYYSAVFGAVWWLQHTAPAPVPAP